MPDNTTVKVGLVQTHYPDSREAAFSEVSDLIQQCVDRGAELVCLQELSFDPYFCQTEDHSHFALAEDLNGSIANFAAEQSKKHSIVLLAGLFERRAPGMFHNSFLIFEKDGTCVDLYRKTHIPEDPSFNEKFYFTPGENTFPSFKTSVGTIGVCICWDQWFPEAARLTALSGAQIIFFPSAIGWQADDKKHFGQSQVEAWKTMMRSHAIANGVFVCATNRTGLESSIEFWGNSFVCDPYGNFLEVASQDQQAVLISELNLSICETARTHWPFLRDRRTDLYAEITRKLRTDQRDRH
ncbi:MAG: carbon-nitrogen hydrolase [Planctomycetota bacterium]|nr:carbon-nitrogen hydrolase [Planctomycetota bacterium]